MQTRRLVAGGLAGLCAVGAARAQLPGPVGVWTGVLEAGSQRLRLKLDLTQDTATLYSLDQGGAPIMGRIRKLDATSVDLDFPPLSGRLQAALDADGRLVGEWRQGGVLPITFVRGDGGLNAAQSAEPLTARALEAIRAKAGSPGMIAAVSSRNGAPRILTSGLRKIGSDAPITASDRWHLGSITKSITSTLAARLVEAGRLSWTDTIGSVLGGAIPSMRDEYRDATFLHLLSHQSGLPGNIPALSFAQFKRENPDPREERIAFARIALEMSPAAARESALVYSNNGYVVAGAMMEAKLGASWEGLMQEHVFAPLGLADAGFGAPGVAGRIDEPVGHAKGVVGEQRTAYELGRGVTDNPAALGPAGRVHMTATDVLAYLDAHREKSAGFLSAASWDTLHTPPFGGAYALGWGVRAGPSFWHNGSNTLWYAEVLFDPTRGVSAFAAANDGFTDKSTQAVGQALLGVLS